MRIDRMSLLGVAVHDLDAAIERYSALFGIEFEVLQPGTQYPVIDHLGGTDRSAPTLRPGARIAIDRTECYELVEMPDHPEGPRNIHFRVDDYDAVEHLSGQGLRLVADLLAGSVREAIFHSDDLNGVRLCITQYEGDSFSDALRRIPGA